MKNAIIFIAILLVVAGCKKTYQSCDPCACININNITYADTGIDSVSFYHALLGTWYVRKKDTFTENGCTTTCFCDTQYFATFLPNDSVIMALPGNRRDTFNYIFYSYAGTINPQTGDYHFGLISYNNNYLTISTQIQSLVISYPPNYFLSRQ